MGRVSYRLLTPIANAHRVYSDRLTGEPGALYEHIWRLIHVHESLVVCLGIALATRYMDLLRDNRDKQELLNDLRAQITGLPRKTDEVDSTKGPQSCLSGAIEAWLQFLQDFGKRATDFDCPFCVAVKEYLEHQSPTPLSFLSAWERISPVDKTFREPESRLSRMRAINSLRNKFAHVPVPFPVLADLHSGLKKEIYSLLLEQVENMPSDAGVAVRSTSWQKILRIVILYNDLCVNGSDGAFKLDDDVTGHDFCDGTWIEYSDGGSCEPGNGLHWRVDPFLRVSLDMKVSILFRLPGLTDDLFDTLRGEYHRFAAEVDPVAHVDVTSEQLRGWLPEDEPESVGEISLLSSEDDINEYLKITFDIDRTSLTAEELRRQADWFFRMKRNVVAVKLYESLAAKQEETYYNDVAKYLHGTALWWSAESDAGLSPEQKIDFLKSADGLLLDASKHVDNYYAAKALYQRSKVNYHLFGHTSDPEQYSKALLYAKAASEKSYDPAHLSWYEKVADVNPLKDQNAEPLRSDS